MPLLSDSLRNLASSLTISALIIAGLVLGREVLIPLTLAVIIAFILYPIVRRLMHWKVPRSVAVIATVTAVSALVVAFSSLVSNEMLGLTSELGSYKTNVISKVRAVTGSASGQGSIAQATDVVSSLGTAIEAEINAPGKAAVGNSEVVPALKTAQPPVVVVETKSKQTSLNAMIETLGVFGRPLAQAALAFLFAIFLLLQYQDLRDRVVRVVGTDHMSETTSAMSEAGSRLSQLFLMQAILNGSFGLFVGFALWAVGVPNAALWGLLAAVLRFVPYVGSLLAAVPPLFLAAAVDPGWTMFAATAAVFVIGEPVMGHIVEPQVLGKKAGISPFAMVASASFWTLLWGPVGLILAAPLTMVIVVMGRYIDGLHFFSILLGDEPALSREQEFYHRLLSDDPVSAIQTFETALDEHSANAAIDDLVLPALTLAAYDQRLGRLDKDQTGNVVETMIELADSLPSAPETELASPVPSSGTVLIIPARGPIDAAFATFVAEYIKRSTSFTVVAPAQSSGLTALVSARALAQNAEVEKVLIVTVGGSDSAQLNFISKRAAKDFSTAEILVLDHRRDAYRQGSTKLGKDETVAAFTRLSEVMARIAVLGRSTGSNLQSQQPALPSSPLRASQGASPLAAV